MGVLNWFKVGFERGWEFIVTPPVEVVSAGATLVKDLGTCSLEAFSKFGTVVLESFKGII